jgi:hypothetical protein
MRSLRIRLRIRIPNTACGVVVPPAARTRARAQKRPALTAGGRREAEKKRPHKWWGGGGGWCKRLHQSTCTIQSGPSWEDCDVAWKARHESFSPLNTFMRKGKDPDLDPYLSLTYGSGPGRPADPDPQHCLRYLRQQGRG